MSRRQERWRASARVAARRFLARAREIITVDPDRREHDAAEVAGARELAANARKLKGGVVKVAQMTAYFSGRDAAVDRAARAELTSLWDDLPPMDELTARQVIEDDLGAPPEELFAAFDVEPFASASIGQVHAAISDAGAELAVKVQYPDAAAAIRTDLASPRVARQLAGTSAGEMLDDAAVDAMRDAVLRELDYRVEAETQRRFAAAYADDESIVVPEVVSELSGARVLTMTLMKGRSLAEVATDGSADERAQAAATIFRFAWGAPFTHGIVNADPNPGNYIIMAGSPPRVAFLDFGCAITLTAEVAALDRKMWRAMLDSDIFAGAERFRFTLTELGMVRDASSFNSNLHREWERLLAAPYARGEFAWTEAYAAELTETTSLLIRGNGLCVPAPLVLLWRQRLGTAAILGSLGATVDFRAIVDQITGR